MTASGPRLTAAVPSPARRALRRRSEPWSSLWKTRRLPGRRGIFREAARSSEKRSRLPGSHLLFLEAPGSSEKRAHLPRSAKTFHEAAAPAGKRQDLHAKKLGARRVTESQPEIASSAATGAPPRRRSPLRCEWRRSSAAERPSRSFSRSPRSWSRARPKRCAPRRISALGAGSISPHGTDTIPPEGERCQRNPRRSTSTSRP